MNRTILLALVIICVVGAYALSTFIFPTAAPKAPKIPAFNHSTPSCISEGIPVPGSLPCCAGLTKAVLITPDQYGGCPYRHFVAGESFCVRCGDGVCEQKETLCSCPNDCIMLPKASLASLNQSENQIAFGNQTVFGNLTNSLKALLSENYPRKFSNWTDSGVELIGWLYETDPALLRDLIAATKNPAGMVPYMSLEDRKAAQLKNESK